jgi:WD40 repeat protein
MRRLWVSLILLGFCLPAHPQEVKPYLRIETGSHTANARGIDVGAAEQFLVSASDDKTARVWDMQSGKLLQILRPPIGDFQEGKLFAVAISPDGKTVAVGGFTGANGSGNYPIYIFERASGTIRKVIGLPTAADHLAYSQDGRNLAASLASNGIRIYETQNYDEVGRDTDYAAESNCLEFDKTGRLISTSYDGYVRLYGPDFRLITKIKPPGGKQPYSARFSPDGLYLAVGFNDSSRVDVLLAKDLVFQYSVQAPSAGLDISTVSWSRDGRTLCAAGRYGVSGIEPVLCWSNAGQGKLNSFPVAGSTIMDLRALRNGGMAFAVADGTVGVLAPEGAVNWRAAPEVFEYRAGPAFPRLSADRNAVEARGYFFSGTEWTNHTLRFSVQDRKLEVDPVANPSLASPVTRGLNVEGWDYTESPTLNGKPLKLENYEMSYSLAIAPKLDSFALGTVWNIYRFDRQGAQVWMTPVPGVAWGVNISSDGRFVVASLGDGTIRWYTYDKGDEVLALFVDRDLKRWVAWTPDGFFTFNNATDALSGRTLSGDALIGYQINRGPDRVGDFVKVDQLREVFYRPDLIAQILKPGGVEAALTARNRVGDVSQVLTSGLPPELELVSITPADGFNSFEVQFRVKDTGGGRGRIVCRINGSESGCPVGREVEVKGAATGIASRVISVAPGPNQVAITVASADGKVASKALTVQLTGRAATGRPNLFVIAAGISHYSDHDMDKGVTFAAQDAESVAAKFKQQEGKGIYGQVSAIALPDSRATVKGISDAVVQFAAKVKPEDTFVLYLSGHGMSEHGEYYFLPWEAEYTNLAELLKKSLSGEAIRGLLAVVHTSKSALILDTCSSGQMLTGKGENEKLSIERVAVISGHAVLAASNSEQMALDGNQGHGVFTSFLLKGMDEATTDAQGAVLITRLAEYVQTQVPDFTSRKYGYRQIPMSNIAGEPFPVAQHKPAN